MEEISLDKDILKELGYNINIIGEYPEEISITKNGKIITEIEIPCGFRAYGDTYRITGIKDKTFYNCQHLQNVIIPNTVKTIGNSAFWHCTSLKNIDIPNGVEYIGNWVFEDCESLKNLTIPKSVNTWMIHSYGMEFKGCKSLENINFLTNNITFVTLKEDFKSPIIHRSIEETTGFIGSESFCDCISLKSINIPNGIQEIRYGSFSKCKQLQNVIIPDSVTEIRQSAFVNYGTLKSLQIPKSVNTIYDSAFYNIDIVYYTGSATGSPWGAKEVTDNKFTYNKRIAELRQQNQ